MTGRHLELQRRSSEAGGIRPRGRRRSSDEFEHTNSSRRRFSWHVWRMQPAFATAFATVQAARAQIDLAPFHERLGAVTARVLDDALNAPTPRDRRAACKTILEAVGVLK